MGIRMQRSSGNVFADAGFAPAEAAHLLVRAQLMGAVAEAIEARGLTQKAVASLLGVSQPRISDLRRGRIERFSVDTLIDMLAQLGIGVSITTKRRRRVA